MARDRSTDPWWLGGRGGMPVPYGLEQAALEEELGTAIQGEISERPGAQALDIGAVRSRAVVKTPEGWVTVTGSGDPDVDPTVMVGDRMVTDLEETERLYRLYAAAQGAQALPPGVLDERETAMQELAARFANPEQAKDLLRREELLAMPTEQRLQAALKFGERPAWQQALLRFVGNPVTPEESRAIDYNLGEVR